eukprot:scaffold1020_cov182-Alexandrium_tamarense.AAC.19
MADGICCDVLVAQQPNVSTKSTLLSGSTTQVDVELSPFLGCLCLLVLPSAVAWAVSDVVQICLLNVR